MFSDHISNSISLELKKNEYGYPHSGALWQFCLKLEHCKPHKAMCHPTKCDIINDVKQFLIVYPAIVYRRIYCRTFLTLSRGHVTKASALELLI